MKYDIETLIVEVGRKCNMNCLHCLRGEPEDVTVNVEDVFKLLSDKDINYIDNITFTGGEPTLYVNEIIEIINYIINNNIDIGGFYIASNGLIVNLNLMMKLVEFASYISNSHYIEDYQCCYDISNDHFHDDIPECSKAMLSMFSFVHYRGDIDENYLIDQGRASLYYCCRRTEENNIEIEEETCEMSYIRQVYLNAKGNILWNCDLSYESQDFYEPLSIKNHSFDEIVKTEMVRV